MSLVEKIVTEVGEAAVKNIVGNGDFVRVNSANFGILGLAIKLGFRFAKTINKARTDGVASFDFAGSASSSAFTLAVLLCHTASKVLPYVNYPQFVPLLVAGAISSSTLADQMALFDSNSTGTLADAAISAAT